MRAWYEQRDSPWERNYKTRSTYIHTHTIGRFYFPRFSHHSTRVRKTLRRHNVHHLFIQPSSVGYSVKTLAPSASTVCVVQPTAGERKPLSPSPLLRTVTSTPPSRICSFDDGHAPPMVGWGSNVARPQANAGGVKPDNTTHPFGNKRYLRDNSG